MEKLLKSLIAEWYGIHSCCIETFKPLTTYKEGQSDIEVFEVHVQHDKKESSDFKYHIKDRQSIYYVDIT